MMDYKEKHYEYYGCSVGEFLNRTYSSFCDIIVDYLYNREIINMIGNEVKEALINSLNLIQDESIKAECIVPVMGIIGYKFKSNKKKQAI